MERDSRGPLGGLESGRMLLFEAGGQRLLLPLPWVREILRAVAVTPLPSTPAVVDGVIVIRGETTPVLDVATRLGRAKLEVGLEDRFIVIDGAPGPLALRVEAVHGLVDVDPGAIAPNPGLSGGNDGIAGLAILADGLGLIQDLIEFLTREEEAALREAVRAYLADR